MKLKSPLIILFFISAITLIYFGVTYQAEKASDSSTKSSSDSNLTAQIHNIDKNDSELSNEKKVISKKYKPNPSLNQQDTSKSKLEYDDPWCNHFQLSESGKDEELRVLNTWLEERGHFSDNLESYMSYDKESLVQLGQQGDLLALQALQNSVGYNPKIRLWAAKQAALHGGTGRAMQENVILRIAQAKSHVKKGMPAEAKKLVIEAASWAEFALLRGDYTYLNNANRLFDKENTGVELLEEDYIQASTDARHIYDDLSSERQQLGLMPFNNSLPKAVSRKRDWEISKALRSKGEGPVFASNHLTSNSCVELNLEHLNDA